jgi:hypothetical protein
MMHGRINYPKPKEVTRVVCAQDLEAPEPTRLAEPPPLSEINREIDPIPPSGLGTDPTFVTLPDPEPMR